MVFLGQRFAAATRRPGATCSLRAYAARQRSRRRWVADMAGYDRLVARPRLFFDVRAAVFATVGSRPRIAMVDARRTRCPDGLPYRKACVPDAKTPARWVGTSRRRDIVIVRHQASSSGFTSLWRRARDRSAQHVVRGGVARDAARPWTYVLGAAYQTARVAIRTSAVRLRLRIPSVFAQADVDATAWLVLSASARLDHHNATRRR